ncbi:MAG: cell division protein FtsA, partial [Longimicrobiaceae bacterium]
TAVVIAEVMGGAARAPQLKVLGVGQAKTSGMRREVVTDIEATTVSIRKAVKEAELMAGVSVERLYVGIAGEHIDGRPSTGVVAVGREEIAPRDVDRVHEVAQALAIPADRELLHAIPQEYKVDAQAGIRDPIGMAGTRLEAEVFIVTGATAAAQNIRKSVSRAGYAVHELVLEPLASSLATLSDEEKEMGVALLELGGGTTDIIIFHERKIRHLATLPWGGGTVTNDIVKGLSLPYTEAVRVKERWGSARSDLVDPHDVFELPGGSSGNVRQIPRELLAHIIEQRMDEIFGLAADQIERAALGERLGAGIVLSGGGAAIPGVMELAERTFAAPVRCGIPGEGIVGLVDSVRRPKFASATGLALYGARRLTSEAFEGAAGGGSPVNNIIEWMRSWLRDFF